MEVADDGHANALLVESLDNGRDRGGGLFVVDGDAHQFGARRARERRLASRCRGCRRYRYWSWTAPQPVHPTYAHTVDRSGHGFSALNVSHGNLYFNSYSAGFDVCRADTPGTPVLLAALRRAIWNGWILSELAHRAKGPRYLNLRPDRASEFRSRLR